MYRILVVEDERPISDLIEMNLSEAGYTCVCAYDGLEAANLLEKEGYDLVLLDIMLPKVSGYELLDFIKPLGIPVIFLTAKGTMADKVKGLRLGADDWRLTLVNTENPLSRDYEPDTAEADNGYLFDLRAVESLRALLQAGREAGLDLVVTSGWRSWAYQEQLFEDKVGRVMAETGLGRAEAEELAAAEVARPGTSEHQLGLAVDIISNAHPELDESWAQTEEA